MGVKFSQIIKTLITLFPRNISHSFIREFINSFQLTSDEENKDYYMIQGKRNTALLKLSPAKKSWIHMKDLESCLCSFCFF